MPKRNNGGLTASLLDGDMLPHHQALPKLGEVAVKFDPFSGPASELKAKDPLIKEGQEAELAKFAVGGIGGLGG
jgi:hypothetical protein